MGRRIVYPASRVLDVLTTPLAIAILVELYRSKEKESVSNHSLTLEELSKRFKLPKKYIKKKIDWLREKDFIEIVGERGEDNPVYEISRDGEELLKVCGIV